MAGSAPLMLADIGVEVRSGGAEALYTYEVPQGTVPGDAFLIPLGPRQVLGHVLRVYSCSPDGLPFEASKLRSVTIKVDALGLPASVLELIRFVEHEYLCSVSTALSPATPPGAAGLVKQVWRVSGESPSAQALPALQREVLEGLLAAGGEISDAKAKNLSPAHLRALKALRQSGHVESRYQVQGENIQKTARKAYTLLPDAAVINAFLNEQGKRRPAQALTLMRLMEVQHAALTLSDIKSLCSVTDQTIRALIDAGLLVLAGAEATRLQKAPNPNPAQQIAIDALSSAVQERRPEGFLLFGVTGSGKTEVYLRAAAEALRIGRKVLFLVPEIALATQAVAGLRDRFGPRVAILHSELSPKERLSNWLAIRSGSAPLVLGARSALFAPIDDVGLIVMDEEHEGSYKQESAPRYHAKRLAEFLSQHHGCPLVLGSATPSLETFVEAEQEKLTLLSLPERAASALLPAVHVEDLGAGFRSQSPSLFSPRFAEGLTSAIDSGHQAILFLNRRAYASFLICRDCGFTPKCSNCAVSLAYSRKTLRLRCHHCGYQTKPPESCPQCGGSRIKPLGVGTEKVEEAVRELLPHARVDRLDRDVTQRKGALEDILSRFAACEIQILVGTQMVAKGLNFPNVTFVGVVAADISLTIPDFRASERTFQLLAQVAGRAGRGQSPGEVVIQTFNPEHPAILCAQRHDTVAFLEMLRMEREQAGYPPYRRLINILITAEDLTESEQVADELARRVRAHAPTDAEVLGPVDCALERLQNRWRRHVLVKLSSGSPSDFVAAALQGLDPGNAQVTVDVDPYSLI